MSALPAEIDPKSLDEIIEIAAQMAESKPERLSAEELRRIAAELDIPEADLGRAIDELKRRRAALLAAEAKAAATRRRIGLIAAGVLGALLLALLVVQAGVRAAWHEVEGRRAQLINVMERQTATVAQWQDAPPGPDRAAELSGAENRVRIERKRYDDAATRYNVKVDGLLGGLARATFGLHARAPLSNEVDTW